MEYHDKHLPVVHNFANHAMQVYRDTHTHNSSHKKYAETQLCHTSDWIEDRSHKRKRGAMSAPIRILHSNLTWVGKGGNTCRLSTALKGHS